MNKLKNFFDALRLFAVSSGQAAFVLLLTALLFSACEQPAGTGEAKKGGISSASDLAKIGLSPDWPLDGKYTLMSNIALTNWVPVGEYGKPFTGTFDGGNKTVTIQSGSGGVFGFTSGAAIRNLTVAGTIAAEAAADEGIQVGGIAGNIQNTTIENCRSSANITVVGHGHNSSAGGIAGTMLHNSTLRNCTASGTIRLTTGINEDDGWGAGFMVFAGGVAGYSGTGTAGTGSSGCLIIRCGWTGGEVYAESAYPYAGGLLGYNYTGARVSECYALDGAVKAKGENLPYAGGLTGYNSGFVLPAAADAPVARVENCYSNAAVEAESASKYALAGGIAGANAKGALIANCYARGTVSVTVKGDSVANNGGSLGVPAAGSAGGIAGAQYYREQPAPHPRIEHCAALNTGLKGTDSGAGAAFNIRRIAGAGDDLHPAGEWTDNIAWSGMQLPSGGPALENAANGKDGTDCVQKPEQAVYKTMGWDFVSVWKMAADGYPALQWQ